MAAAVAAASMLLVQQAMRNTRQTISTSQGAYGQSIPPWERSIVTSPYYAAAPYTPPASLRAKTFDAPSPPRKKAWPWWWTVLVAVAILVALGLIIIL